ncbi:hypothetical protein Enr13x_29110 [Stieleria neptunia]|uniref:HicB family protein n=1 Tax=Stieleria neptunia TaxID=2527979 RepID=A0A518HQC7_9BACT|nr:hypothetical protein [Stieleria neptunia]QDV43059.1 hypothetical protein Enr13x_29110 [Stieleria neptunia]
MSQPNSKEINPLVETEERGGPGEGLRYASDPSPDQAPEFPTLELTKPDLAEDYEGRCRQALLLAEEAFAATGSWVVFFREILGIGGVVKQLFSDQDEFKRFVAGPEFATLHEMLAAIRSQDQSKSDAAEPERMITIRIPRSLHESLQEESKACGLSINKLSISKLLLPANPRFVPEQQGRRRGRRPGPQGRRSKASAPDASQQADRSDTSVSPLSEPRILEGRRAVHSWADRSPQGSLGQR